MQIFISLPILSFILLVLLFNRKALDWRKSVLLGAIAWGYSLTAITESLSRFNLLSFSGLLLSWGAINIVLIGLYQFSPKLSILKRTPHQNAQLYIKTDLSIFDLKHGQNNLRVGSISDLIQHFKLPAICWVWLAGTTFFVATVGLIAIIAPPNTWDSMTYHMSRVAHWEQNRNVAHYPTYNLPQLFHPPFAELRFYTCRS